MHIGIAVIGPEGAHAAGRSLLQQMYRTHFGQEMPPIAIAPRGKPYFENSDVQFSISHTKTTVFCALSHKPVGIDAEQIDRDIRLELAHKILSAGEMAQFLKAEDRRTALLRFWVLKEAAAKCAGTGLQGYPTHTNFSLDDPRVQILNGCFVAVVTE